MSGLLYALSVIFGAIGAGLIYWGIGVDVAAGGEVANLQVLVQQLGVLTMGTGALIVSGCTLAGGAITEAIRKASR